VRRLEELPEPLPFLWPIALRSFRCSILRIIACFQLPDKPEAIRNLLSCSYESQTAWAPPCVPSGNGGFLHVRGALFPECLPPPFRVARIRSTMRAERQRLPPIGSGNRFHHGAGAHRTK